MAAQACNHRPWDAVHLEAYMGYWGHAARLGQDLRRPITIALLVWDEAWMSANPGTHTLLGRWPNAVDGFCLMWRRCRLPTDPLTWEHMAADRQRWKEFTDELFLIKSILKMHSTRISMTLICVIEACSGPVTDAGSSLRPIPPIDPPYPSSHQVIENPELCDEVAIMPPYGEVPKYRYPEML